MAMSDAELARSRNIRVEQVRELRLSRGTTNDTLEVLPDGALRRAIQRLAYPDRPALRDEFRALQTLAEDATPPSMLAVESAVNARDLGLPADGATIAGLPTGTAEATGSAGIGPAASWEWLGPGNIGGRTRGIVVDPGQPARMWAASAGGGVWHTGDGGTTWATVGDFLGNLACSCLVLEPAMAPAAHPTIYVGTGEGFGNVDAIAGNGIFTSTDGTTWRVLAATQTPDFRFINRVASSGGVLLAATTTGIFRSSDPDRVVWTKVLDGRVADVKFDPRDNGRAVAGGARGGEVWLSTDGGQTWSPAGHGGFWLGRVELAYATGNPDIVYASVQMANGEIWRSVDGGATYVPRRTRTATGAAAPYLGDQGWYANAIWAGDPTDPNLVVVGGVNLWRSTDGGDVLAEISTWSAHPDSAHADQHAIVAHPDYDGAGNRTVFFGNDGGVCVAADLDAVGREDTPPYTQGWTELANAFGATQFYGGAGNPTSGMIIGGAQDNGTLRYHPAQGTERWTTIFGGDGGWCAADPTDPDFCYGEYTFLNIHRNTDGGTTEDERGDRYISGQFFNFDEREWDWKPIPHRIPDAKPVLGRPMQALFIAPFLLDPNEPNRILAGGRSLWRTNDARTPNTDATGPTWASIKDPLGAPNDRGLEISALAIAAGDSDTVWAGHVNGAVFRTADATAASPTWLPVTSATFPPRRYCACITVDPVDKRVVYVAFAAYARPNLWRTRDGGATWTDVSATLPAAPVRAVAVHPRRTTFVYAGTEVGLFASEDGGATWTPTNQGPANCSVDDLFWMGEDLVSVTHGRGMFRIDLSGV
jgi:photosystem II stability/assembly factor-like uncharacterized protein